MTAEHIVGSLNNRADHLSRNQLERFLKMYKNCKHFTILCWSLYLQLVAASSSTGLDIRPLQINFLFPVLHPHASGYCSKYSYSSILFRLFLHSDWTISPHVSVLLSSAIKSAQTSRLCYLCYLRGRNMLLCSFLLLIAFVQLYQAVKAANLVIK